MIAKETQQCFVGLFQEGRAQLAEHQVGIGDMAQVGGEIVHALQQWLVKPGRQLRRFNLFKVQRPMVFHGHGVDEQGLCAGRVLQQFADLVRHGAIANKRPGFL